MKLCDYGCEQEAHFQMNNGKWCCSKKYQGCPEMRRKNSSATRVIHSQRKSSNYRKQKCKFCKKEISLPNLKRHELKCFMNPINYKECPVCGKVIKNIGNVTCSQGCARKHFVYRWSEDKLTGYGTICWRYHEKKCVVCGESNIVEIHHYDGNHDNNDPSNLVPLCPTHHSYMHYGFNQLIDKEVYEYIEEKFGDVAQLGRAPA